MVSGGPATFVPQTSEVVVANVSKLLYSRGAAPSFLGNLDLSAADDATLRSARTKIRDALRTTVAEVTKEKIGATVKPRFFTQGSYSYKTINDPVWTPPQQMDLDDGAYLPMTFVQGAKPSVAAAAFFEIVDKTLIELGKAEGWRFVEKPTCSRLVISENGHVDVPLYAIPDAQFVQLEEARLRKTTAAFDARSDALDRWDALPSDCVLLAHREHDWISSDPRKIHAWFKGAIEVYGEQLRRVCRYLKAWRDYNHPEMDSVSSILLMVCAFNAFEEVGRFNVPDRDDLALLKVAERLPRLLHGPVYNPADLEEQIDARLDDRSRGLAVEFSRTLGNELAEVVTRCFDPSVAIDRMRRLFGDRIPDRVDLVDASRAAVSEVKSHAPRVVAAPTVGKMTSG